MEQNSQPNQIPPQQVSPVTTVPHAQTLSKSSELLNTILLGIGANLGNIVAWSILFSFTLPLVFGWDSSSSDTLQVMGWLMMGATIPFAMIGTIVWPWFFWHYRNKITIKRIAITAAVYDIIYTAYAIAVGYMFDSLMASLKQYPGDYFMQSAAWIFFFLSFPIIWGTNRLIR